MKYLLSLLAALVLYPGLATGGSALGDWGHYLRYAPRSYLLNPDGRAFTVQVHTLAMPVEKWNRASINCRVTDPDGKAVIDGAIDLVQGSGTLAVPAGPAGVYRVEVNLPAKHPISGPDFWLESDLEQAVVGTGGPTGHAVTDRWLIVQCAVPRRWWFWVPEGTMSFTCRSQWIQSYQSQREDWGITIYSPRGQRVRRLWGDVIETGMDLKTAERTMTVEVPVEPGSDGRFWAVELRFADSHNYSKCSFSLEGVPPYLARSPEAWFDPTTGAPPEIPLYDDDTFMQFSRDAASLERWPWLQHFAPSPAIGDPDGNEIRGAATIMLRNPENRPLSLGIGTYLPRTLGTGQWPTAHLTVTGADGSVILDNPAHELRHLHGSGEDPLPLPATGVGTLQVRLEGAERWMFFTYPAVPSVLTGRAVEGGWQRFDLDIGGARNWYFRVPEGTRSFRVRARTGGADEILLLAVNAPDRTVAQLYGRQGELEVEVPPGLDGLIWHLRPDIGSASVLRPTTPARYQGLTLQLDLHGIPAALAPTWEQWFDHHAGGE